MPDLNLIANRSDILLVESIPVSVLSNNWKYLLLTIGSPIVLVGVLGATVVAIQSGWQIENLWGPIILGLLLGPFAIFLLGGLALATHLRSISTAPVVELREDQLTVHYGNRTLTARITDCQIYRGRAYQMSLRQSVRLYSWEKVILIGLPRQSIGSDFVRIAVGYTPEMCERWTQALGVAFRHPRSSIWDDDDSADDLP